MANHEHLNILWQDVEVWNQWRQEHPDIQPDLGGTNLSRGHANLRGTNLSGVDLSWNDLSGANLSEAELCGKHS